MFVFPRAVFHLPEPGVLRRFFPYPLSLDHAKRLNRFGFAIWPCLLLLVQHPGQSPLDAQKPNLSHVASRHSFRARFALEHRSQRTYRLPMIVAKEELIIATHRRRIQRIKRRKSAARSTEIRPAKFREKLYVI